MLCFWLLSIVLLYVEHIMFQRMELIHLAPVSRGSPYPAKWGLALLIRPN
jgi:hypothetical protein